jgi:hypothetical protein
VQPQPLVKVGLICDYALTGADGRLSVIGIFNNINFQTLPAAYPQFFVVLVLNLERGTHPVHLGITNPVGQQLLPEAQPVDVQVDVPGAETNLVIGFNNVQFERPGIYQVQLFVSGRLTHSIPVNVQAVGDAAYQTDRPN